MAIISMLLGGVAMLRMQGSSQLAGSAQQVLISAFNQAKNLASSKHERARVIIYKGDDDERMLRHIAILYEETDEDGNSDGWVTVSESMLPKGSFFIPPSSDFNSYCDVVGEGYTNFDVIKSTFSNGTSGVSSIVGISQLTTQAQNMNEGSGEWYSYEFAPEGFSENTGSVVAVGVGSLNGTKFIISKPEEQLGFVVRRFNCIGFSSYYEMKESLTN